MLVELANEDPHVPPLQFAVDEIPVKIGRSNQATVQLMHPLVSRLHCELYVQHGRLRVRDLNSTNQTLINNRVIRDAELTHGDDLAVGGVVFSVRYSRVEGLEPAGPGWTDTLSTDTPLANPTTVGGYAAPAAKTAETPRLEPSNS